MRRADWRAIGFGSQRDVPRALSDGGPPARDPDLSACVAALGAPVVACTPDRFPTSWARKEGITDEALREAVARAGRGLIDAVIPHSCGAVESVLGYRVIA